MKVGAVILAAGAATRMGTVKQLLRYRGQTLIEHAIHVAAQAGFSPLIVVLGANAAQIIATISDLPCRPVINQDWEKGMGTSLKAGMEELVEQAADCDGAAALLADQPRVSAHQLASLLRIFREGIQPIVAAEYGGSLGVPAIFGKAFFPMLRSLPPTEGARHVLRNAGTNVFPYPIPEAAIDVDTPQDYALLD